MKPFLAVVATVVGLSIAYPGSADELYGYVGHKKYISKIHPADVDEGPTWDRNTQPCPPLAAIRAVEAAKKVLAELFQDAPKWSVNQLTLAPHAPGPFWYWVVDFHKVGPTIEFGHIIPSLSLVVLMSGKAVKPEVVDWDGQYEPPQA